MSGASRMRRRSSGSVPTNDGRGADTMRFLRENIIPASVKEK
jgi:hypothetical protein